jgi:hypothetical protein
MTAFNLAGARLLEPLGRALVGLQLWHKIFLTERTIPPVTHREV